MEQHDRFSEMQHLKVPAEAAWYIFGNLGDIDVRPLRAKVASIGGVDDGGAARRIVRLTRVSTEITVASFTE